MRQSSDSLSGLVTSKTRPLLIGLLLGIAVSYSGSCVKRVVWTELEKERVRKILVPEINRDLHQCEGDLKECEDDLDGFKADLEFCLRARHASLLK